MIAPSQPIRPAEPRRTPGRRGARSRVGAGQAVFEAFRGSLSLLRLGLVAALAVYLFSGVTRVGPQEDAVVLRLGARQPWVHGPGLLWAFPAPIDEVVTIPTRLVRETALESWAGRGEDRPAAPATTDRQYDHLPAMAAGAAPAAPAPGALSALMLGRPAPVAPAAAAAPGTARALHPARDGYTLTADRNLLQGRFTVRWKIREPLLWLDGPRDSEGAVESAVYRALTHELAGWTVDDALGSGRERLRQSAQLRAQAALDTFRSGLEIVSLDIRELLPPQAVLPAFQEVVSARVEAQTMVDQARSYQAQIGPKVAGESYRLRQEADAQAAELRARAAGEARAFLDLLSEYQAHPALLRSRLTEETVARVWPRLGRKVFLPSGPAGLKLFLDENDPP